MELDGANTLTVAAGPLCGQPAAKNDRECALVDEARRERLVDRQVVDSGHRRGKNDDKKTKELINGFDCIGIAEGGARLETISVAESMNEWIEGSDIHPRP